ncbi:LuxR C-terminal-related transcriptional regulator [uncultured Shewanella sp.]|uniref:LuxR C-terminal-related transcriptional regulator n=1 Tax=Shewanella atlantica TaxID=271099 RepID=UPI0026167AA3|nr:LuxR C-terminal-related transcriptional regulator [uncultured Shewanella sp.]
MLFNIQQELNRIVKEIDICDLVFCVDIKEYSKVRGMINCDQKIYKAIVNRRQLFSTNNRVRFLRRYIKLSLTSKESHEKFFKGGRLFEPGYLSPKDKRICDSENVYGAINVLIDIPVLSNFAGRFIFLPESHEQLGEIESKLLDITLCLKRWLESIPLACYKRLNPLIDYRIVGGVSCQVLNMLANGADRSEVASSMRLTERGVDYHISSLKHSLNAKNLAHLVFVGANYRLIAS